MREISACDSRTHKLLNSILAHSKNLRCQAGGRETRALLVWAAQLRLETEPSAGNVRAAIIWRAEVCRTNLSCRMPRKWLRWQKFGPTQKTFTNTRYAPSLLDESAKFSPCLMSQPSSVPAWWVSQVQSLLDESAKFSPCLMSQPSSVPAWWVSQVQQYHISDCKGSGWAVQCAVLFLAGRRK